MTGARIVVPQGAPPKQWLAGRAEGVTASEIWDIARGGIRTWRRIVAQKMNGSTFRGTRATRAGSAREAALLDEAAEFLPRMIPSTALWAAGDNDRHRATPDGVGNDTDGRLVVVEVKSHEDGWDSDQIPADHLAQVQWQIRVLDAAYGLYGFEVRDEDDMPPAAGATWERVDRDEEMIAWLILRADQFLAWWDAGCPDVDTLPPEVEAARAAWVPLKAAADAAATAEKTAAAALRTELAKLPHAERFGAVGMGADGGYQYLVTEKTAIDEIAWAATDPDGHARAQRIRDELATAEVTAARRYPLTTRSAQLRYQKAEAHD